MNIIQRGDNFKLITLLVLFNRNKWFWLIAIEPTQIVTVCVNIVFSHAHALIKNVQLALVKAVATLAAPAKLANRAVKGEVTGKYLEQLKDVVVKFDKGELKTADMATLLGLWATTVSDKEEIPPEFKVPKMTSSESIRFHAARAKAIAAYEKAGAPVPESLLTIPQ